MLRLLTKALLIIPVAADIGGATFQLGQDDASDVVVEEHDESNNNNPILRIDNDDATQTTKFFMDDQEVSAWEFERAVNAIEGRVKEPWEFNPRLRVESNDATQTVKYFVDDEHVSAWQFEQAIDTFDHPVTHDVFSIDGTHFRVEYDVATQTSKYFVDDEEVSGGDFDRAMDAANGSTSSIFSGGLADFAENLGQAVGDANNAMNTGFIIIAVVLGVVAISICLITYFCCIRNRMTRNNGKLQPQGKSQLAKNMDYGVEVVKASPGVAAVGSAIAEVNAHRGHGDNKPAEDLENLAARFGLNFGGDGD